MLGDQAKKKKHPSFFFFFFNEIMQLYSLFYRFNKKIFYEMFFFFHFSMLEFRHLLLGSIEGNKNEKEDTEFIAIHIDK